GLVFEVDVRDERSDLLYILRRVQVGIKDNVAGIVVDAYVGMVQFGHERPGSVATDRQARVDLQGQHQAARGRVVARRGEMAQQSQACGGVRRLAGPGLSDGDAEPVGKVQ